MKFTAPASLKTLSYYPLLLITALMLLIASGCGSSRKSVDGENTSESVASLKAAFDQAIANSGEWEQLQVPVKLSITAPEKFNISGRAYMVRNEQIYMSMRMLGLEVATLHLTADSLILLDKFHRRQIALPIAETLLQADITVADIQDALLGRPFINGNAELSPASASKFRLAPLAGGKWSATPSKKIHNTVYSFIFNADNTLERLEATINSSALALSYSDPAVTSSGTFSQMARLATKFGKTSVDLSLRWNFGSVKWNVGKGIPSSRPYGYQPIDLSGFIKSID